MTYQRNCPNCNKDIFYKLKGDYNRAVKENRKCKICGYKTRPSKKITNFSRNCPKCNNPLSYKSYFTWYWAKKHNQLCRRCIKLGKVMPVGFSEKISKIVSGKGNPMYGKHHTEETKKIISLKNTGNKSKTGQTSTEESKNKMRIAFSDRIKKYGKHKRGFNPVACNYLSSLNQYSFRHALNGGEFCFKGYFADGYDAKKNVWIEYDEPRHYNKDGTLKQKDIRRMLEIKKSLGCKFLRYNEKLKELKEW